ncbi:carboxypeptidase-like regulatory domain-containing protein [Leptospirillum ferriphilum]|uniref:carboxypeptidase-like regulatory domain-containing protein n=1 Tax=Leptospirillum ferriphilum TaxID=178606 RepID=UPI00117A51B4|nr:carboxypeptidase-like regulatory domain-containing protein [Leptospirillum ferriphilum]
MEIPAPGKTVRGDVLRATGHSRSLLFLSALVLLFQTACSSSALRSPEPKGILVTGSLRSGTLTVPKTALYVTERSPSGRNLEVATDLTGHFRFRLPPGTYSLHAAPVSSCPVDNTFIIPPGSPPVHLRVLAPALTFTHCPPSRTIVVGISPPGKSLHKKTRLVVHGFLVPAPGKKASLFLIFQGAGNPVQEVSIEKNGTFDWTPPHPGSFVAQAALAGFCPVYQTFRLQKESHYLILSVHPLGKSGQCSPAEASVYSGAFSLPPIAK